MKSICKLRFNKERNEGRDMDSRYKRKTGGQMTSLLSEYMMCDKAVDGGDVRMIVALVAGMICLVCWYAWYAGMLGMQGSSNRLEGEGGIRADTTRCIPFI